MLVSSQGWQLLGIQLLKVLGYVNMSLTLRRVNSHGGTEGWGRSLGCAVLLCSSRALWLPEALKWRPRVMEVMEMGGSTEPGTRAATGLSPCAAFEWKLSLFFPE